MPDSFDYFREYRRLADSISDLTAAADEPTLLTRLARYRLAGIADVPAVPADETDVAILVYMDESCYGLRGLPAHAEPQSVAPDHLCLFERIRIPVPCWSQLRDAVGDAERVALDVLEEGKLLGMAGFVIWGCVASYALLRILKYPQWPHPRDLVASDWCVLFEFNGSYREGQDWPAQRMSHEEREMKANAPMDPALPHWFSKDESRPNPWVSAVDGESEDKKSGWDQMLRSHLPALRSGESRIDQLLEGPVRDSADRVVYERVVRHLTSHAALLLVPLGVDEDPDRQEWRWSPSLCILAGLGRVGLSAIAEVVARTDADVGGYWGSVLDLLAGSADAGESKSKATELDKLLNDARVMCGYPMSLLRVPYPQAQRVCEATQCCPHGAMQAMLLLWLLLRIRAVRDEAGLRLLITGNQAQVLSPAVDPDVALSDGLNAKVLLPLVQDHLGIRRRPAPAERIALDDVIARVFKSLKPGHFLPAAQVDEDPSLVLSSATSVHPAILFERRLRLGDVGVEVGPLLRIDPASGVLDHDHMVRGLRVTEAPYCRAEGVPVESLRRLPSELKPSPPFSVMRAALPQLDDLGHPGGLAALKDAVLLVSLLRRQLASAGTVGSMVQAEFPLLVFHPHATKVDETQGFTLNGDGDPTFRNGKTTAAVQEARILSPGIAHNGFSRGGGGPALREQAATLRRFGHDVVDEFVFLRGDMFYSRESLKELATGGSVSSGVYAGNGTAPRLRHPLFLSAKLPDAAAEVTSRTLPTFFRQLSAEMTRSVSESLRDRYLSGHLSLEARLRGLLWAEREHFIAEIDRLPLVHGDAFRFQGHLSVAYWIAEKMGSSRSEVDAYLIAAGKRCAQLRSDGQSVAEEIGATNACDPRFYLAQMTESEASMLCEVAKLAKGHLKPMELAIHVLGGGDRSLMRSRLGRMSDKRFIAELRACVQAGEFANEFVRITAVPDHRRSQAENRIVYHVQRLDLDERFRRLSPGPTAFFPAPPIVSVSA